MNNAIARLENQIITAQQLAAEDSMQLLHNPDDFALRLACGSFSRHLEDLQHQLYLAKAERQHEVIHQRLIGPSLSQGSIPLALLARLADFFGATLTTLAYRFKHGGEMRKTPEELVRMLDLRLADIALGSTRLTIVGNTAPDLAGTSLLEMGMLHVFGLLNDPQEDFAERVAIGGFKATRKLDAMLREMERERIGVEMSWLDPQEITHAWNAAPGDISRARSRLGELTEIPTTTETISGEIELLATTGRIQLRTNTGQKLSLRYPRAMLGDVQRLQIGGHAQLTVSVDRVENKTTQQMVEQRTLKIVH